MTDNSSSNDSGADASNPLLLIFGGIAVFIICSIVQAAGGSSMFQSSFEDPDSALLEILMQVTWWPGWILTILLIGRGVLGLVGRERS